MASTERRAKLVSGGRLQLPADFRRSLDLGDGDAVRMTLVDGEVRIRPARPDWARIDALVRKYVPDSVSLVDELIADRRAEAARE